MPTRSASSALLACPIMANRSRLRAPAGTDWGAGNTGVVVYSKFSILRLARGVAMITQLAVVLVVGLAQQAENPELKGTVLTEAETPVPAGPVQDRTGSAPRVYSAELDEEQHAWVEKTLAGLSVREMAAQVLLGWGAGFQLIDSAEFDIALAEVECGVGGTLLMGGLPHANAAKLTALHARAKVPLLVFTGPGRAGTDMPPPWPMARSVILLPSGRSNGISLHSVR